MILACNRTYNCMENMILIKDRHKGYNNTTYNTISGNMILIKDRHKRGLLTASFLGFRIGKYDTYKGSTQNQKRKERLQ